MGSCGYLTLKASFTLDISAVFWLFSYHTQLSVYFQNIKKSVKIMKKVEELNTIGLFLH